MLKNKKNNKDQQPLKEKQQKIMQVYSQHSVNDYPFKSVSLPLKKTHKQSITNPYSKQKESVKKEKTRQSTVVKIKAPEVYERIPINVANSNTNSEIDFSNSDDTLKEGCSRPIRKALYIDCDREALIK